MKEQEFIAALAAFATNPAARGLRDDAALLDGWVLTHDMIVEGVHFLASDPPEDVAWKLVAVNLSDLAAKGAQPIAALMGAGLGGDTGWTNRFLAGLKEAVSSMGISLIGGDTVALPAGAPRCFGLTAIGKSGMAVPSRSGAMAGDSVYIAGAIGDAGLGLAIARGEAPHDASLLASYRRPVPLVEMGRLLAPNVSAMMDVSDGLLIDAQRMAIASGVGIEIALDQIPLSHAAIARVGDGPAARLAAATAGDDYALLFTAGRKPAATEARVTRIGRVVASPGLFVNDHGVPIDLPESLGWLHG